MPHPSLDPLASLHQLTDYEQSFMSIDLWRPFVHHVAQQHQLPQGSIRTGTAGTYPTFIVGDSWVVKFYGTLFAGMATYQTELAVNQQLNGRFPAPALLAHGSLLPAASDQHPWPYLVFAFQPGQSAADASLNPTAQQATAVWLATHLRHLHQTAVPALSANYGDFLAAQRATAVARHRAWGTLPPHLLAELHSFLPSPAALRSENGRLHLIHADMTGDHVLGLPQNGRWQPQAIIDLGDAMLGTLAYELIALHLDLFQRHPAHLATFLTAYGVDENIWPQLCQQAFIATLLHRFNVLATLPWTNSDWQTVPSLAQLGHKIWPFAPA